MVLRTVSHQGNQPPHPAVASGPSTPYRGNGGMPHQPQTHPGGPDMGLQATAEATPTRDHRDHRDPPGSHASAYLPPEPAAAARARRLTRTTLTRWNLGHLADDAETVASELTSNALDVATEPRGTLPAIIFAIHRRPGELRIIVWDNGPGQPHPAAPGPNAETGRGLAIVAALSHQWGWWPTPNSGGKVVWAALEHDGPQATP